MQAHSKRSDRDLKCWRFGEPT